MWEQVAELLRPVAELKHQVTDLWVGECGKKLPFRFEVDKYKFFVRVYTCFSPFLVFTLSPNDCFLLIFSGFKCEGLGFKAFTQAVKHSQTDFS